MNNLTKEKSRLGRFLDQLELHYGIPKLHRFDNPFEMILWEIVAYLADDAQRTTAFEALRTRVGLTPDDILKASSSDLCTITLIGGRIAPELRATRLQEASELVVKLFDGDSLSVLKWQAKEARKALMQFPMTGEPGAEKILMYFGVLPVLALDSNGLRVLTRLGFGEEDKNYSKMYRSVREAASAELPANCELLTKAHLLLRHHGQVTCRRAVPACPLCPLNQSCPSSLV